MSSGNFSTGARRRKGDHRRHTEGHTETRALARLPRNSYAGSQPCIRQTPEVWAHILSNTPSKTGWAEAYQKARRPQSRPQGQGGFHPPDREQGWEALFPTCGIMHIPAPVGPQLWNGACMPAHLPGAPRGTGSESSLNASGPVGSMGGCSSRWS